MTTVHIFHQLIKKKPLFCDINYSLLIIIYWLMNFELFPCNCISAMALRFVRLCMNNYHVVLDVKKETVVCKNTVFVMILSLMSYMPV
jgi:hypothetical protein